MKTVIKKYNKEQITRDKKYCSCLMKVRGTLKKSNPRSPYAICTSSIYNKQNRKRTKRIKCSKYYKFSQYNMRQLGHYAKEKKIKLSNKGRRLNKKQLITQLIQYNNKKLR